MKYKLITSKSLEDFSREVTQAMNNGWGLYSAPIITRMESSYKMIYSQGVVFGYRTNQDVKIINSKDDLKMLDNYDFWVSRDKDTVIDLADTNSDIFRSKVTDDMEEDLMLGPLFVIIRSMHEDTAKQLEPANVDPVPVKEKK